MSTELTPIDKPFEASLSKFEYTNESLAKKVEDLQTLTSLPIETKADREKIHVAYMDLKSTVVDIGKKGKALREGANNFIDTVLTRERELTGIVTPLRDKLQKKRDDFDDEQERLKAEAIRVENERIQKRIDDLAKFNYGVNYIDAKEMSEEKFNQLLKEAEEDYNAVLAKAEAERIAREEEAEAAEYLRLLQVEQMRLERIELDRVKAQQEEDKKRMIAEHEERERELQRERDAIIEEQAERTRKANEALEQERKLLIDQRERFEAEKRERDRIEAERLQAIEDERLRLQAIEEEKVKEEERERLEAEAIEQKAIADKLEAERLELLRPDKESVKLYIEKLILLPLPNNLKSKQYIDVVNDVTNFLDKVLNHVK